MLAVYILSFGGGYVAGKRKLADINTLKGWLFGENPDIHTFGNYLPI
jgi:hypothetical protein